MSVAKVVRLRVEVGNMQALDGVLHRAREAFTAESGTVHWDVYESGAIGERTLVEIFADVEAVRRHDDSAAVATLLSHLEQLGVDVVAVDHFSQPSAQAPVTLNEKED